MTKQRTRLPAEQRREIILEAARKVFLETGFAGARTRRIAEEAGITEAFLYRHFASKTEIYEVAVLQPLEELLAALLETTNGIDPKGPSRRATLLQVNEMLLRFMADSAPFLATILLAEMNEGRRFYQNDFHPLLAKPINDVVAKITRWPRPKDDSSLIFAAMFGVHMGLAIDAMLRDHPIEAHGLADQLTRLFSDGMPEAVQAAPVVFREPALQEPAPSPSR